MRLAAERYVGLDYSYELIAERGSADRLVRTVCDHLAPEDRARVLDALSQGMADVMDHVRRDEFERQLFERGGNDVCVSFLFAEDEHLAEYAKESPLAPIDGRVRVGCVWTSIECGSSFVLVRATAATTGMSRLFERSPSVRATFAKAGHSGGALLVLFDDEREDFAAVWPFQGRFARSGGRDCFDDECKLKVDEYCADLVTSARRSLGDIPADTGAKPEASLHRDASRP
jgi:hypothetical protein